MGYLKIPNLYKDQTILLFKEVYTLEKVHGTSSHIQFKDNKLSFYSGGAKYADFIQLFDSVELLKKLQIIGCDVVIYGEAYGGKMQRWSHTYGNTLKFVAFDVKINNLWLCVPDAEQFIKNIGLSFVPYVKISTSIEELNKQRDKDSELAKCCGISDSRKSEGIVIRPLVELIKNNGERVICKHKRDDFSETKTLRSTDLVKLKKLTKIQDITEEWVTENRLLNILSHFPFPHTLELLPSIIKTMIKDVIIEAKNEIEVCPELSKFIGSKTVKLYKIYLQRISNDKTH